MSDTAEPEQGAEVEDVGRRLRELRKARNLTQSDLAQRIGIQQSDLCRMEKGRYRVRLETLMRILQELDVSVAAFFSPAILPTDLSESETSLLHAFRRLPADRQEEILRYAHFISTSALPQVSGRDH